MSKILTTMDGWAWVKWLYRNRWRIMIAGWVAGLAMLGGVLAGCGPSHSSVPPSAKASAKATASQVISGIRTGQAAQQAEGIARACAAKTSGLAIITCIAPHAPKGAHRRAFEHCGKEAFIQDIPGQEVKWVQVDLPGCLVANR